MAKMFYTMDEAKIALGRTEDEIKQLSKDGKLREFRDGAKLMFKADQVEALKGALPPKDVVGINDSGAPISLVDSKSGSSSGIPLSGGSASGVSIKDDTGMGEPALGGSKAGSRAGGSRSGSGTGMNIFNVDDSDPSAATAITPASESGNLEAVGSGSGLLDLTRESDDTSLGAVLDDIAPGKRDAQASRAGSASGIVASPSISAASAARSAGPAYIVRPDASVGFFGGMAGGACALAILGLFVIASGVAGAPLQLVRQLADMGLLIIGGIFLGVIVVGGAIGFGVGKVLK